MGEVANDLRERAEYYRLRAHRKVRSHYLTAKYSARMHTSLGVPVVAISAIVGTTVFATFHSVPGVDWDNGLAVACKIATGLLSMAAAVLAALQTFFGYSELSEKHRTSAAEYAAIKHRLDLLQLRPVQADDDRDKYWSMLETIIQQLDQLEKDSPDVPDRFYDRAVKEQQSDLDGV